tara:strand:+ start:160 stop:378 length:219 start_codon:yes stop_codon:yes gene_type:complete
MTKTYIDNSVYERGNIIISGIIVTKENIDKLISESLQNNGFLPEPIDNQIISTYTLFQKKHKSIFWTDSLNT